MAKDIKIEIVVDSKGNLLKQTAGQMKNLGTEVDKTNKSTKRLDKAQSNQYNSQKQGLIQTANSTKNFSKLSNSIGGEGPGGLVRAYALLAANVFAVTAAFGVLSRSAEIDTLTESMEILSTRGGTSIDTLSKSIVKASGGAIDLANAFRQVSLASSAGLSTAEIEGLTTVARGAAVSLGRNLPDAMDRIFRGAIKLEPEILDEIGLFVRVDEAARKYAQTLGRSVTSLSQADKRQAFLNEILDQGIKKFEEYAKAIEPNVYAKLAAALGDVAQRVISVTSSFTGLKSLIGFLAENTGILTGLFLLIGVNLLNRAIPAIGQFTANLADSSAAAASDVEAYVAGLEKKTKSSIKANKAIAKSDLELINKTGKTAKRRFQSSTPEGKKNQAALASTKNAKTELQVTKRIKAVQDRQQILRKVKLSDQSKSKKNIKQELLDNDKEIEDLKTKKRLHQDITKLKANKGTTRTGTVASMRSDKLSNTAMGAAGMAVVMGSAETQGMVEGFKVLSAETSKLELKGSKMFQKIGKGAFFARGAVGVFATGMQALMMAMGPYVLLVGAVVAAFVLMFKNFASGQKEAKELGATVKQLGVTLEKVQDRFDSQIKQSKDSELSFLEQTKATLAFNMQQLELGHTIITVTKQLAAYRKEANGLMLVWQGFLSLFGGGVVKNSIEEMNSAFKSMTLNLKNNDDIELHSELMKIADASGKFGSMQSALVDETASAASALAKFQTGLQGFGIEVDNDRAGVLAESYYELAIALKEAGLEQADLTDAQKTSMLAMKAHIPVYAKAIGNMRAVTRSIKEYVFGEKELAEAAKLSDKVQKIRTQKLKSFIGAIEGATDAVGKFTSSFLPKTKADEIVGSLDQIFESFTNLTKDSKDLEGNNILGTSFSQEQSDKILKNFSDMDNAIKQLFSHEELEIIQGDNAELAVQTIITVQEEFSRYRRQILASKAELAALKNEMKLFGTFAKAGANTATETVDAMVDTATLNKKIGKSNLDMLFRTVKIEGEIGMGYAKRLKDTKDMKAEVAQIAADTLDQGKNQVIITEVQGFAIAAGYTTLEILKQQKMFQDDLIVQAKQKSKIEAEAAQVLLKSTQQLLKAEVANTKAKQEAKNLLGGDFGRGEAVDNTRKMMKMDLEVARVQSLIQDIDRQLLIRKIELLIAEEKAGSAKAIRLKAMAKEIGDINDNSGDLMLEKSKEAAQKFANGIAKALREGGDGTASGVRAQAAASPKKQINILKKEISELQAKLATGTTAENVETTKQIKTIQLQIDALSALRETYLMLTGAALGYVDSFKELGSEGELVASVIEGTIGISDGFLNMKDSFKEIKNGVHENGVAFSAGEQAMLNTAAKAEFAATALTNISSMLAQNSKTQTAEIDKQIEAEQKRDGSSKESLAKIDSLEKKKLAKQRKAFEVNKKLQMAITVASTAASMMNAVAPVAAGGLGPVAGLPLAGLMGAMGALQLAVIARTSFGGGGASIEQPKSTSLSIGGRSNNVDVSKAASSGELSYSRGEKGVGSNANDFRGGGATGIKGYAAGGNTYASGGVMVGEQGPERIDVVPNEALTRPIGETNVNFAISAVDGASVERMLQDQQGNIISMIQSAANSHGDEFLPQVDASVYNASGGGS